MRGRPYPEVVRDLREAAGVVGRARALGVAVAIRRELVDRCRELIDLVPLRTAVLMVIKPGDEVTAPIVVARLAELDLAAGNVAVSGVLGYWSAQGTLERRGRGRYRLAPEQEPPRPAGEPSPGA